MNKTVLAILGSALLGVSMAAVAADPMMGKDKMTMMDSDGDGKISKEEYMAYHEKMWMGMKKDSNGMVDAKMMMKDKGMMKDGSKSDDKMNH